MADTCDYCAGLLQRPTKKDGKTVYYRGCCAKEFLSIFKRKIMPAVKQVVAQHKQVFRQSLGPVFCMDHDSIHKAAMKVLPAMGVQLLPHPAKSPDFNKPIEHIFGQMKGWVHTELRTNSRLKAIQSKKQVVHDIFYTKVIAEGVSKDVKSMPDLYKAVIEARGDWPASHNLM